MIYLDNAATTFPKPEVSYKALDYAFRNLSFNAGRGSYKAAQSASKIIDETRAKVSSIVKTNKDNVIFSSSATEALNQIIYGINFSDGDNVYITPFEHNAIVRTLYNVAKQKDINIIVIPFNKYSWKCEFEELKNMFVLKKPKAIIISHISNATGYILPYKEIFHLASSYFSINVLDCAQSFGVVKIDYICDINYIVFAGHKTLYSCFGIAGFIKLKDDKLIEIKCGGTGSDSLNMDMPFNLPGKFEAGSSNIVAIYCLHESIDWVKNHKIFEYENKLTKYLIEKLQQLSKIHIFIPEDIGMISGIVSFDIEGYKPDEVGAILNDEFDICVRTGYHCAPLIHDFIGSNDFFGTVRVSLGFFNTFEDIDNLIRALQTF